MLTYMADTDQRNMCVEFILSDEIVEFECNNKLIIEYMKSKNIIPSSEKNVIVFDLHNVLDKINPSVSFKKNNDNKFIICCSYIGYRNIKIKETAKLDIQRRIKSKQIDYGVLVFKRGKRTKNKKGLTNQIGSKAWFCDLVNCKIFFDDGADHIESVKKFSNSKTQLVDRNLNEENLINLINKNIAILKGGNNYYSKYLKYKIKYLKLKDILF